MTDLESQLIVALGLEPDPTLEIDIPATVADLRVRCEQAEENATRLGRAVAEWEDAVDAVGAQLGLDAPQTREPGRFRDEALQVLTLGQVRHLLPFGSATCVKCAHTGPSASSGKYCARRFCSSAATDHLHVSCPKCGYRWMERCADAAMVATVDGVSVSDDLRVSDDPLISRAQLGDLKALSDAAGLSVRDAADMCAVFGVATLHDLRESQLAGACGWVDARGRGNRKKR